MAGYIVAVFALVLLARLVASRLAEVVAMSFRCALRSLLVIVLSCGSVAAQTAALPSAALS
jgi:hypothetical protein